MNKKFGIGSLYFSTAVARARELANGPTLEIAERYYKVATHSNLNSEVGVNSARDV